MVGLRRRRDHLEVIAIDEDLAAPTVLLMSQRRVDVPCRRDLKCDQEMLVRKERKVRRPSRNTEASSHGCESRPVRLARQAGSEPCDGHAGERVEAGRQRARRCVGARACEPCEVSPENFVRPEGPRCFRARRQHRRPSPDGTGWRRPRRGLGTRRVEEDDPVTWDTRALGGDTGGRRQGRPKSGPACAAGVGGALYEQ
jgi:hypothetical protein